MTHLSDDELQTWADGEAPDAARAAAWGGHVDQCGACAARVAAVHALGRGVRLWGETVGADGLADDLVEQVMRAAAAEKKPATGAKPGASEGLPANVVPMRARRRWIWGAAPVAIAAAAALVFAIVRPMRPPHGGRGTVAQHDRAPGSGTQDQAAPVPLEPDLAPGIDPGSEVLLVEAGSDHATYSVMQLQMKESGTPVAVVWIDENSSDGPGAVQ
jgi:hypothetical protein